jgi:Domain of unknown function (DUF4218)
MREKVDLMMCHLEQTLPPGFFVMQTHLLCHLVDEVAIAGPVHARWMYWVERYMKVLKSWVRQPARPEGSMAMGYLTSESLFFLGGIIGSLDREAPTAWEEAQDEKQSGLRLLGASKKRLLGGGVFILQVHNYVLENREELSEWRNAYRYYWLEHAFWLCYFGPQNTLGTVSLV